MTAEPNLAPPHPGARRRPERGSSNPYATYVDLDAPPAGSTPAPPPPPAFGPPATGTPAGFAPRQPLASFVPAPGKPKRARTLRTVALTLGLLLAAAAGVGSYGANAYARSKVCEVFAGLGGTATARPSGDGTVPGGTVQPRPFDAKQVRGELQHLRGVAVMLVYDGDLQRATRDTADGLEHVVDIVERVNTAPNPDRAAALAEIQDWADRLQQPVSDGQRACGQTVTGLQI